MKNAVKTFSQALSAPEIFPVEDRLKMAQYLSDGGDKETAIQVLSKILESDPANKRARTLLVKEITELQRHTRNRGNKKNITTSRRTNLYL